MIWYKNEYFKHLIQSSCNEKKLDLSCDNDFNAALHVTLACRNSFSWFYQLLMMYILYFLYLRVTLLKQTLFALNGSMGYALSPFFVNYYTLYCVIKQAYLPCQHVHWTFITYHCAWPTAKHGLLHWVVVVTNATCMSLIPISLLPDT